jgi:hypothetical protein
MDVRQSRTELARQHALNTMRFEVHHNSLATYCDSRRSGRGKPRSPARQAGLTGIGRILSRSILPEWTFGKAEPSSLGNPRQTPCDSRCTTILSRLTAIHVAQVAASREVLLGKQDLLSSRIPSTSILPEWTFGKAEPSSHGNTHSTPCDAGCTTIRSRLTAIHVAQVAASREVLLGKQDLLELAAF